MTLSPAQRTLLLTLASGATLKAHRYIDGRKLYQLHGLDGEVEGVMASTVAALVERGLIDSNKKFPAASFWLTPAGRQQAGLSGSAEAP